MTINQKYIAIVIFFIIVLTGVICCKASDGDSQRSTISIKSIVLESAENLYRTEKQIINNIDDVRYSGMETELSPILRELMNDVIYLLEWVLEIDPNDIRANFLLGKIYYGKSNIGEGFRDRKLVELAKECLSKVVKNDNNKLSISKSDVIEARKMYEELNNLHKNSFIDR